MLSESHLKAAILICSSAVLLTMVARYLKDREHFLLDSSTYVVLLSLLYIALPTYVHIETRQTVLKASFQTILYSARYSVYFVAVISLYYVAKGLWAHAGRRSGWRWTLHGTNPRAKETPERQPILIPIRETVIYAMYSVIVLYLGVIYVVHFPSVKVLWSNRVLASEFAKPIYLAHKIPFIFYVTASLSIYLCLKKHSSKYLLLLLPFVLFNLATAAREFLYSALLLTIGVRIILKQKVYLSLVLIVTLILVAIGPVRATWRRGIQFENLLAVPGEFLLSAEAGYTILESSRSVDVPSLLVYSVGAVFTPMLMRAVMGGNPNFSWILCEDAGKLWFGLGGSLLCEVYSTKSQWIRIVYPFLLIGYTILINKLLRLRNFFGILIFLFFLAGTHALFRTGVIYFSCQPLYYGIYAASWYWVSRVLCDRRTHLGSEGPLRNSRYVYAG